MGMKNHEVVPLPLISSIASIHRGATSRTLKDLTKLDLACYERGKRCLLSIHNILNIISLLRRRFSADESRLRFSSAKGSLGTRNCYRCGQSDWSGKRVGRLYSR